jgi:hypothetical protein
MEADGRLVAEAQVTAGQRSGAANVNLEEFRRGAQMLDREAIYAKLGAGGFQFQPYLQVVETAWLRRQIGVVLQENVLFDGSVRSNIALADPGMPMERVVAAARLAGAREPDKFESESAAFFARVAQGYAARAQAEPQRFARIPADQPRETVWGNVAQAVALYLKAPA